LQTPAEAVAIGKALEELEAKKAKERQKEGRPKNKDKKESKISSGNLPQDNTAAAEAPGKTRDKVAEAVGMSGRTYEKAKKVVEAAEKEPEKFAPIKAEMDRTGKVDRAYQKVRPSSDVVKGWKKKPDETGADWAKRLGCVTEAEKRGHKREFDALRIKAINLRGQEERRRKREQREEAAKPMLHRHLFDETDRLEVEGEMLATVDDDAWKLLGKNHPGVVKRFLNACNALAELSKKVDKLCPNILIKG
jgi:hypothetical protein